jgi:predicted ATPase/DNA-binding SARP family transcriptional activator
MSAPELRISLLGGFAAAAGDRSVSEGAWRLRKAKSLVKLLAMAPEHRLHRERASELLWPDRDAAAAANNLHQVLYVARRALETADLDGSAVIELHDDALTLRVGRVDVEEFERAAAGARGSGDRTLCQAAVDLYAGELLPEDRYEDWTAPRREALREQCIALLLELAGIEQDGGDTPAAVGWLQRALVEDPLHEEAHRQLMTLFALSGRRQQALAQYQRLRQALRREFEDVPDAETRRLYQSILSGSFGAEKEPEAAERPRGSREDAEAPRPHNLPLRLTSFVGRERELTEVWRLLDRGRLVTLTGPGGCGKTRLAIEAAGQRLRSFPDGVWLVELAPLLDGSLVGHAVAEALGLQLRGGTPAAEALAVQLAPRKLLLVLDNCEHVIDSCARLADELLRSCVDLTILATSREPLRVPGELAWRVPSLSLPDASEPVTERQLLRCEAGRLFCQRAAEAAPGFEPGGGNAPAIAEICLRLDGMPLALELAAARVPVLSPQQIAERLGDSLRLLAGGSRTALTRQQTLRATLSWSHELLGLEERLLFGRLAAFSGSFALDAVEGICAGDGLDRHQLLDLLGRLVDKSLVIADQDGGEPRYRLLETIRQYAAERLEEAGERRMLEQRHLEWYERFAFELVPPPGQAVTGGTSPRLDAEHGNLGAALAVALRSYPDSALRLAVALWPWWLARSHFAEGARALEAALERSSERTELRAQALLALVALHVRLGDPPGYVHVGEEAISIRRELGNSGLEADALLRVGQYLYAIDGNASGGYFDQAFEIAAKNGDRFMSASIAHARALLACSRSQYADASDLLVEAAGLLEQLDEERADAFPATTLGLVVHDHPGSGRPRIYFEETILLFRPVPARLALGYVLCNHAFALRSMGNLEAARDPLDRALALFRELRDLPGIALALNQLGNLGRSLGDYALAREWLEEALAIRRELGDRRGIGLALGNLGLLSAAAGAVADGRLLLAQSQSLFERTDDGPGQGGALLNLANLELSIGNLEEGRRLLERSLPFWEAQDLVRACAWISLMMADVLEELDEPGEAARRREAARKLFERLGDSTGLERIKGALRAC